MRLRRKSLKTKSELGRKLANARWAKDRARRDAEESARLLKMEIARITGEGPIKPGQFVGTLQWHGADGKVRRWVLRRGERSGQVLVDSVRGAKTVTWLTDRLRRHIASHFRTGQR